MKRQEGVVVVFSFDNATVLMGAGRQAGIISGVQVWSGQVRSDGGGELHCIALHSKLGWGWVCLQHQVVV